MSGEVMMGMLGIAVGMVLLVGCEELQEAHERNVVEERRLQEEEAAKAQPQPMPAAEPTPPRPSEPPIKITAAKLFAAYDENEIAADQKFKGKNVCVEGRIEKVGSDMFDEPTVLMRGRNEFQTVAFTFADKSFLAELKKRQEVRICGVGGGSFIGSPVVRESAVTAVKVPK